MLKQILLLAEILIGLVGLCLCGGSINLTTPIPAPTNFCGTAEIKPGLNVPYSCCPPKLDIDPKDIPYYKLPPVSKLRVRPAAHAVDEEYMVKFNLAIKRMKELDVKDPSDPRGFLQQANIHCAYCNGAYKVGDKELQVHYSWLFFPYHRWYLYFYERILGSLINDTSFALPYWNWDHPKGMRFPPMFDQPNVYPDLYNPRRNKDHRGQAILDLVHFGDDVKATDLQRMCNNMVLLYRQMGVVENIPHTPVHIWVGTVVGSDLGNKKSDGEDMGNFYTSGLDPAFYCHHANVDRMWTIWQTIGGKRKDIDDPDFLNAELFFYDENKKSYRVKVRRTQQEKDAKEEMLTFKNLRYDVRKQMRFDVFINAEENSNWNELNRAEFSGSYTNLPHIQRNQSEPHITTIKNFQLAINELLEEIGLEDEYNLVVTLVPKIGGEFVTIESAEITYEAC
ncbi:Polyphenol oxidase F, chloroplastic [Capsicum baccatum]|uniref:catechol oxidase n=1 Tax=Capsicum baccatum TaxID=33114 RepID=A0A2G2XMI6_CAPBA|nr:Polyphenol oxidase F, chloroplastic [Capsicum baccatum]